MISRGKKRREEVARFNLMIMRVLIIIMLLILDYYGVEANNVGFSSTPLSHSVRKGEADDEVEFDSNGSNNKYYYNYNNNSKMSRMRKLTFWLRTGSRIGRKVWTWRMFKEGNNLKQRNGPLALEIHNCAMLVSAICSQSHELGSDAHKKCFSRKYRLCSDLVNSN